ncbi:MAG TPA: sugar ABC transporter substrate-binding protein [Acetobacteraceae bacterium]|jgi:ABC-type glycerol-3-phosphate transport system substrate-binding protein|nr:sugar ABC transporter substrate-binding protein [Acetobacteraceae bacterium]
MIRLSGFLAALLSVLALCAPAHAGERGPATADCPQGVLTLTLLKPQANPPTPAMISAWEASNKCTKIELNEVPFGQLADKISVLAASGNPPDILMFDGPNTQSYAASGILLPLDKYLPAGLKDDIDPATLAEHSYEGHVYSPGTQQTALALFYNADMLAPLGITPPRDLDHAWTWDQAMDAIKKCQKGEGDNVTVWGLAPSRFGSGNPGFVYRDLLFLRTYGDPKAPEDGSLYKTYWSLSRDGKTAQGWVNSPEAIEGAKFFSAMFNVEKITPKAGIPNAFQDRKACFTIDTSYFIGALVANDPGFKWGVTPLPYKRTPIVHTGSITLGVTAKSKFPDEAAKFVIEVSTGTIAADWNRTSRSLPVMKSIAADIPELKVYPLSIFEEELVRWGEPRPPSPHFAQYDKIASDALRDIAYGADPKTRIDAAARALQPILSR